jgi:hypothetical protein
VSRAGGYRPHMTDIGMRPPPDPDDPFDFKPRHGVEGVPDEEHLDSATVEEELETEPDEARNATDGYAPADDEDD